MRPRVRDPLPPAAFAACENMISRKSTATHSNPALKLIAIPALSCPSAFPANAVRLTRQLLHPAHADAVILRLRVMREDRRRRLLRYPLESRGQLHPQFGLRFGQQPQDRGVILQIR